jgi:hypothetical protein
MDEIKRLNYFDGQFLVAADFQAEQNYHRQLRYHHNRTLHSPGIVDGLEVTKVSNNNQQITVSPGHGIDAQGREMLLTTSQVLELASFGSNAIVFITLQFNDTARDEADRRAGDFARIPERPMVLPTDKEPLKDNSVIILARVQLDSQGNIGTIDESLRSRHSGAVIASDTVSLEHLTKPVRELITGHNHDGSNGQKISPTNLAGVNSTVTATNLNILCSGLDQDASKLHFHETIPKRNGRYHVPLIPQKLTEIRNPLEGIGVIEKKGFFTDGTQMVCPRDAEAFGTLPLHFPPATQLDKITIDFSPTRPGLGDEESVFQLLVELKQSTVGKGQVTIGKMTIDSRKIGVPFKPVSESLNHRVDNSAGPYCLFISVLKIPNASQSPQPICGVCIQAIIIDYTIDRLF